MNKRVGLMLTFLGTQKCSKAVLLKVDVFLHLQSIIISCHVKLIIQANNQGGNFEEFSYSVVQGCRTLCFFKQLLSSTKIHENIN